MPCVKAKGLKLGQTVASIKVSGKTIRPMGRVFSIILTEMSMRESGSTIRLMDMVHTLTPMEPSM